MNEADRLRHVSGKRLANAKYESRKWALMRARMAQTGSLEAPDRS